MTFCFITISNASESKLIYFYESGCRWCTYMDEVINDSSIKNILLKNTDIIRVDVHGKGTIEGELTEKELARKYRVNSVPTLIFLNTNREELLRVPGAITKEDFRSLLCDNLMNFYNC
ncbi:MAG: thioredoxin fold domain-containing protein [Nitrospirota bacterium]